MVHPSTPRPISNDAGNTVPAHFDLGYKGQLSKLAFRPTVEAHIGYVCQISDVGLEYLYTTRATFIRTTICFRVQLYFWKSAAIPAASNFGDPLDAPRCLCGAVDILPLVATRLLPT